MTLGLLIFETGWEATKAVNSKKDPQLNITSITIEKILPLNGDIWYDALVQVLLSTNIAIGLLPVITGKFIYKGDAIRYLNVFSYFFFFLLLFPDILLKNEYSSINFFFSFFFTEYLQDVIGLHKLQCAGVDIFDDIFPHSIQ